MATIIAPAQGQLARFVVADLKGGEQAHAFRMSLIRNAIEEALKGNFNFIREARDHATGKSRKAAAYQAGFTAMVASAEAFYPEGYDKGGIAKVPYVGRLDAAANASARSTIALQADVLSAAFERGYVEHDTKAAQEAKAKAAERKATKAAPAPEAPVAVESASVELEVGELVAAVASALAQGMVSGNEAIQLREALASYDALQLAHATPVTPATALPEQAAA